MAGWEGGTATPSHSCVRQNKKMYYAKREFGMGGILYKVGQEVPVNAFRASRMRDDGDIMTDMEAKKFFSSREMAEKKAAGPDPDPKKKAISEAKARLDAALTEAASKNDSAAMDEAQAAYDADLAEIEKKPKGFWAKLAKATLGG